MLNEQIDDLRRCISVFFAFIRRHSEDEKFTQDIKWWLNQLISLLLKVSNYEDNFFILNHIIRCPGGTGNWASQFVQPMNPYWNGSDYEWNDTVLDQLIVLLSVTVLPIK